MKRSICGAIAGLGSGIVVVVILGFNNMLRGPVWGQPANSLWIVALLSILGSVIGGTGDIVAAIKQGRPSAKLEGEDKTSVSVESELRGKANK